VRLVNRYVCREFLKFFCMGLAACTALYVLAELFDRVDEFIERRVFWYDAGLYLAARLPVILYQLIPVAILLASVLTFSTLNRHHEITAMRASGIAPRHLTRSLFVASLLGCLTLVAAQEYLIPYSNQAARMIWRTRVRHDKIAPHLGLYKEGHIWYRAHNRIWSAQLSNPFEQRLQDVVIFALDSAGNIVQRYDAQEAQQEAQEWLLRHGTRRRFDAVGSFTSQPERFKERRLALPERFIDITARQKLPDEMSTQDILAHAHQLDRQGLQGAPYLTEFHGRFAFAAASIIMAGFGLPLAVGLNRSGRAVKAIGLTVCCGFSYWVLHAFVMALGHNGQLPPLLAAWSANICFGVIRIFVSYRVQ
jgi:lipopolysaccharide export system permease protein